MSRRRRARRHTGRFTTDSLLRVLMNRHCSRRSVLEFESGVNNLKVLILSADCSLPIVA